MRIPLAWLLLFWILILPFSKGRASSWPPASDPSQAADTALTHPVDSTLFRPAGSALVHPVFSTRDQAMALLNQTSLSDSSEWWPNVRKTLFIENLRANILHPLAIYQGSNTNFCGYAALSYLPLQDDPVRYVQFMLDLYIHGRADWNKIHFIPSSAVRKGSGTLRFKGILDIRPADQMWFLVLADHFRTYLNFFNRHFHPGAEDTFWAAVSYGKFNRMVREMMGYQVEATGSDIIRPHFKNLFDYLSTRLAEGGVTYLYVNNVYLHKKSHDTNKFRNSFPTHFIVLTDIHHIEGEEDKDLVDIIYWDYGGRTLRQVNLRFLKKIIFGVSHVMAPATPKNGDK